MIWEFKYQKYRFVFFYYLMEKKYCFLNIVDVKWSFWIQNFYFFIVFQLLFVYYCWINLKVGKKGSSGNSVNSFFKISSRKLNSGVVNFVGRYNLRNRNVLKDLDQLLLELK